MFDINHVVIFLILAISRTIDSISTVLLLENFSGSREVNKIPRFIQSKLGLRKGEILISFVSIIFLFPTIIYFLSVRGNLHYGWLLAGIYLGFSLKQLQNGVESKKAAEKTK